MKPAVRFLTTGAVVLVAIGAVAWKYRAYLSNPWTRNGQVRAYVIQIAPRVTGPIVELPIADNQLVRAGDLLMRIDPRTFEVALDQAQAQLDQAHNDYESRLEQVEAAKAMVEVARHSITQAQASIAEVDAEIVKDEAEVQRQKDLLPKKATSQRSLQWAEAGYAVALEKKKAAEAGLAQANASLAQSEANLARAQADLGAAGEENARLRAARAAVRKAELDLEFTRIVAPVDGHVTNLTLRVGSMAVAGQPALALVDSASYWIHGYFKETVVAGIQPGDRAVVTLMAYPDDPLEGRVESLNWGISQKDGSTGFELLPNVAPTYEWIRLAQRVPVRIRLDEVPEHIELRVGTTASVLVIKGSAGDVPPVPGAFR